MRLLYAYFIGSMIASLLTYLWAGRTIAVLLVANFFLVLAIIDEVFIYRMKELDRLDDVFYKGLNEGGGK